MEKYLKSHPLLNVGWYGPRTTDVSELGGLLNIGGIIACYGTNEFLKQIPVLVNDVKGKRQKISIDDLAAILISTGKLPSFVTQNNITTSSLRYNPELEKFCEEKHITCLSSPEYLKNKLRDKTKIDS